MLRQIVEIAEEGRFLSSKRGSISVSFQKEEHGLIPFDDVAVLLVTARGATFSKEVLTRLNEKGGVAILCGKNYSPVSYVLPHSTHYNYTGRLYDQIEASKPLKKQIWKSIIQSKILNQSKILHYYKRREANHLAKLSETISSGDKENREAHAARIYWPALFGDDFRRNVNKQGTNSLLNYGYGVLRGIMARAVCSSGLEPALGVHHISRVNNLCLVDDLMEPFRPVFDIAAAELTNRNEIELKPDVKQKIIQFSWLDLETDKGRTPLIKALEYMLQSLVDSFQEKRNLLYVPSIPEVDSINKLVESCF